jgi:hypothetical protein
MEVAMKRQSLVKSLIITAHLLFGSLCVAAGYVTNKDFNELIESTTQEQRKTASAVTESITAENSYYEYTSPVSRKSNEKF